MARVSPRGETAPYLALIVGIAMVTSVAFGAAVLALPPAAGASTSGLSPAAGSSEQWAFGGIASDSFSCSTSTCFGNLTLPNVTSFSVSISFYFEWAVLYTLTNVSPLQQMMEVQTALNGSASLQLSECVVVAAGQPCSSSTVSFQGSGVESGTGFSNITNGTVNLTSASGAISTAPALALENAQSSEQFNLSVTESVSSSGSAGGPSSSATISLDAGGSESSTVQFGSPLGIVPLAPQAGDSWTASAPYSAAGSYHGGSSATLSYGGNAPYTYSNWTTLQVSPTGSLTANGTDLGASTLYDNYTTPPTSVTAQLIDLNFGTGNWTASDGWLLVPIGVYVGLGGALGGTGIPTPLLAGSHLAAVSRVAGTNSESTYYTAGQGFVGAQMDANLSSVSTAGVTGPSGSGSPSYSFRAGPEPISVAETQYHAILAGRGGGASALGMYELLGIVVVVVAVIALAAALVLRRSRRRPPTATFPPMAAAGGAPAGGPTGPSGGAAATGMAAGGPPPVCPTCGVPATYVESYQRYYCPHDQRYL